MIGHIDPVWNGTTEHHLMLRSHIDPSWAGRIHSPYPILEIPRRPNVKVPDFDKVGLNDKEERRSWWGEEKGEEMKIHTYKPGRLFVRGKGRG